MPTNPSGPPVNPYPSPEPVPCATEPINEETPQSTETPEDEQELS